MRRPVVSAFHSQSPVDLSLWESADKVREETISSRYKKQLEVSVSINSTVKLCPVILIYCYIL